MEKTTVIFFWLHATETSGGRWVLDLLALWLNSSILFIFLSYVVGAVHVLSYLHEKREGSSALPYYLVSLVMQLLILRRDVQFLLKLYISKGGRPTIMNVSPDSWRTEKLHFKKKNDISVFQGRGCCSSCCR